MSRDPTCERIAATLRDRTAELPDEGFLQTARVHISRCPRCAHLPGIEPLLSRGGRSKAPLSRSISVPAVSPASPGTFTSAQTPEAPGPVVTLMVFSAVVALAFAARSLGEVLDALARPPDVRRPPALASGLRTGRETPVLTPGQEITNEILRDVCREAILYLERMQRAGDRETRGRISGELREELDAPGLLPRVRAIRRSPAASSPQDLGRLEAILLRAAAAGEVEREWRTIQAYVGRYQMISSCRRLLDKVEGRGKQ